MKNASNETPVWPYGSVRITASKVTSLSKRDMNEVGKKKPKEHDHIAWVGVNEPAGHKG